MTLHARFPPDEPGVPFVTERCVIRSDDNRDRTLDAMALVTRTYMTDDLDGSENDVSTVRIAPDKVSLSSFTFSGTFLSNYLASSRPYEDPLQHSYLRRRFTGLFRARTTVRI